MGDHQPDVAAGIGKERSTVANYERGERSLSLTDIIAVAERLDYPPAMLLLKLLPVLRSDPRIDVLLAAIVQQPAILPTVLTSVHEGLKERFGTCVRS